MKRNKPSRKETPDKPNNLPFLERSEAGRLPLGAPGRSAKGPAFAILPRCGHTTEAAT